MLLIGILNIRYEKMKSELVRKECMWKK